MQNDILSGYRSVSATKSGGAVPRRAAVNGGVRRLSNLPRSCLDLTACRAGLVRAFQLRILAYGVLRPSRPAPVVSRALVLRPVLPGSCHVRQAAPPASRSSASSQDKAVPARSRKVARQARFIGSRRNRHFARGHAAPRSPPSHSPPRRRRTPCQDGCRSVTKYSGVELNTD